LHYKIGYPLILGFAVMICLPAQGKELDPRSYINIPIDQNFVGLVYAYSKGDIFTSPSVPIEDLTIQTNGPLLAYLRTFALFAHTAKFDVVVGQACVLGEAVFKGENVSRKFCGVTDTKVRLGYNFYGAPPLSLKEYVGYKKSLVIGTTLQISAPTGAYDTNYVFNIGSNRWYIKPEIGMSIPIDQWEFDFSLGVKVFTANNELKGTSTLRQDPIYNFQMHIVYDISRRQWIALDANYFQGGDTFLDGVKTSFTRGNFRGGLTYSYAINSQHSIKLLANTGVTTRLGNDSNAYGIGWTYRWQ